MTDSLATPRPRRSIHRAIICDALVFLMNLLLSKHLLRWLTESAETFNTVSTATPRPPGPLGYILAGAFVCYSLGCWLKRGPLQERMGEDRPETAGCVYAAWLVFMVSLTIFGGAVVMTEFNTDSHSVWNGILLGVIVVAPVVLGIRAMGARKVAKLPAWRRNAWLEIPADILIIAAILPVTIIWQQWVSGVFTENLAGQGWGMRVFACFMSLGAFALFYFAPRLVLVFDRLGNKLMWGTFAFAAAPVLRSCLFP